MNSTEDRIEIRAPMRAEDLRPAIGRGSARALRRRVATAALGLAVALVAACGASSVAQADTYAAKRGSILTGITGSTGLDKFESMTGSSPAILQHFVSLAEWHGWATRDADRRGMMLMLHVGSGNEKGRSIVPGDLARGDQDRQLVQLAEELEVYGKPTYIRLMAEMNNANNPYSAYDHSGRSRGKRYSQASFKRAWRRAVVIMRGGKVAKVDAQLARLGMRKLNISKSKRKAGALPRPKISFLWVPMVGGKPDISGNDPAKYWPGGRYVDWVGTDFYSLYPNFSGLERFYRRFAGKPFAMAEWGIWGGDDPAFVRRLSRWMRSHGRVGMALYFWGYNINSPFALTRFPGSTKAIRGELASKRFVERQDLKTPANEGRRQ